MGTGSLPPGLSLGQITGVISGTPILVGVYNFTVQLTDSTQLTVTSQPLRITVVPGPLRVVTTGDLTRGGVGTSYFVTLAGAGGLVPYAWSLASGALPAGLSLNQNSGVISGTPTQYGTFSFTVGLSDSQHPPFTATSATLRIIIDPAPLIITSSGDLTNGRINVAYSYQLVVSGGRTPYVWALAAGSGPLPTGLTLNPATGVISGTPIATGQFPFTVTVTDGTPTTVTSSLLRITITP
jgi:hypothetical protein